MRIHLSTSSTSGSSSMGVEGSCSLVEVRAFSPDRRGAIFRETGVSAAGEEVGNPGSPNASAIILVFLHNIRAGRHYLPSIQFTTILSASFSRVDLSASSAASLLSSPTKDPRTELLALESFTRDWDSSRYLNEST